MESIHFKEDTAKPENRTNLALLSILQIGEIHEYITKALRVPNTSMIFPSPNLETEEFALCQRPDYVVKDQHGKVLAYAEVELGAENEEQLRRYRASASAPVLSIVGKKAYAPKDLSLEEVYDLARELKARYRHTQRYVSLELFCKLVHHHVIEGNCRSSNTRSALSEKMLASPLVRSLYELIGEDNIVGVAERLWPGKIRLDTVKENGLSVRIYSKRPGTKGFSVLSRSGGRDYLEFPSLAKLRKYFPSKKAAAEEFAKVIADLGARDIMDRPEKSRAKLQLDVAEDNIDRIVSAIKALM